MMNKPYIDELSQKGESRYTLIAVAAKRARQITADNPELSRSGAINPVSQALHEINDDKLKWHHHCKEADPMPFAVDADFAEKANMAEVDDESQQEVAVDDSVSIVDNANDNSDNPAAGTDFE